MCTSKCNHCLKSASKKDYVPELSLPMANLVLAASNQASFFSSTWSAWASAPHDLLLVTQASIFVVLALKTNPQDGNVGAHCGILLPLSRYRSSILEAPTFAGPLQVIPKIMAILLGKYHLQCFRKQNLALHTWR